MKKDTSVAASINVETGNKLNLAVLQLVSLTVLIAIQFL